MLARRGDDVRIDWGYLYLAADRGEGRDQPRLLPGNQARAAFRERRAGCRIPTISAARPQRRCSAMAIDLGRTAANPVSRYLMLAYDDLYSIEYFQRRERAWWRRKGAEAADLLREARRDHDALAGTQPRSSTRS